MIRPLDPDFAVAPQIAPEDMAEIAALGFQAVVNNRPEGEAPDQPAGETLRAAATAAGLRYAEIPVAGGFSHEQLDALGAVVDAGGPVLAFCASGTRSCFLWALASARRGADPQVLAKKAAVAGYSLAPVAGMMAALAP
ncbi:TIGR01244 family sulfur transferase [Sphingomonas sp.]|uniref:TIGR01244 family sulfur transferase n=1 Tax=Sphingomonas sp. TaxID=28214 RepID=UPI001DBC3D14|nr:TIGR01244 family sulfur transferase [Sphingomonas sp.]MBX9796297.1 TIGR01244 family phosphatase [Sphingomonas sp.]